MNQEHMDDCESGFDEDSSSLSESSSGSSDEETSSSSSSSSSSEDTESDDEEEIFHKLFRKYKRKFEQQQGQNNVPWHDVLPRLTTKDVQQFRQLPHQLFKHLILDGRKLMKYKGPLVVANKMMCKFQRGRVRAPCFFCSQPFVKILDHMKTVHNAEIDLMFADKSKIGAMSLKQFRSHLVNRARFRDENYLAWWLKKGVLVPGRITDGVKKPSEMIFCCFCFVPIVKSTWDKHCTTCVPIQCFNEKPTPRENRFFLRDNLGDFNLGKMRGNFEQEVVRRLEKRAKRLVKKDLVFRDLLNLKFATRPREIRPILKLGKVMCHFFIPLLAKAGVALPSQLLQFRHKAVLTRRLRIYKNDQKTKIKVLRAMKILVEQNSWYMLTQFNKGYIEGEDLDEAFEVDKFMMNSPEWQLPYN